RPSGHRPFPTRRSSDLRAWDSDDPVPDIIRTLNHAARCQSTVNAAILIESALNKRCLSMKDLDRLLAGLPQRKRHPLARVRADAQSGTETAVRWWLEERRVRVRSQAQLLPGRSEEHTSELQSRENLVCRLLLEKKKETQ